MAARKHSRIDWRTCALRLASLIPVATLHPEAIEAALNGRRAKPWCCAFSGGADSLALLLLLWAHWPDRRSSLTALHFNHGLRGAAANRDAAFCGKVGAALGVRVRVGKWRRTGSKAPAGEAILREARHAFFAAEMKRIGSNTLWLAHHADDVAETLLMRVARGSGTAGLAAPRPVHELQDGRRHLRPLLAHRKSEIERALRAAGASWCEDATNATPDYFRNRVRQRVLPALAEAAGRDVLAGATLSRTRLEEDDRALEAWVDRLRPIAGRALQWTLVADAPRAIRRRALHRWLLRVRPRTDLSRQGFEQLLLALERGKDTRFSLGADSFAVLRRGRVTLVGR